MKEAFIPKQAALDLANQALGTDYWSLPMVNRDGYIKMSKMLAQNDISLDASSFERGNAAIDTFLHTGVSFANQAKRELFEDFTAADRKINEIRKGLSPEKRKIFNDHIATYNRAMGRQFHDFRENVNNEFEIDDKNHVIIPMHLREIPAYANLHGHRIHRNTTLKIQKQRNESLKKISDPQPETQKTVLPFVEEPQLEVEVTQINDTILNRLYDSTYIEEGEGFLPKKWAPGNGEGIQAEGVEADRKLLDEVVVGALQKNGHNGTNGHPKNGRPQSYGEILDSSAAVYTRPPDESSETFVPTTSETVPLPERSNTNLTDPVDLQDGIPIVDWFVENPNRRRIQKEFPVSERSQENRFKRLRRLEKGEELPHRVAEREAFRKEIERMMQVIAQKEPIRLKEFVAPNTPFEDFLDRIVTGWQNVDKKILFLSFVPNISMWVAYIGSKLYTAYQAAHVYLTYHGH